MLGTPAVAIGAATRETLRIGDVVEDMLRRSLEMLETDNHKLAAEIGKMDNAVDSLHTAVKLYLARLGNEDLTEDERRRARLDPVNRLPQYMVAQNNVVVGDIDMRNLWFDERQVR